MTTEQAGMFSHFLLLFVLPSDVWQEQTTAFSIKWVGEAANIDKPSVNLTNKPNKRLNDIQ